MPAATSLPQSHRMLCLVRDMPSQPTKRSNKVTVKSLFSWGALLFGIYVAPASAVPLTVYINAHVAMVSDTAGLLGGQLAVGQTATGKYTYETSVPDQEPDPMYGVYSEGISQALTQISAGPLVFASDAASPNWNYTVTVHPSYTPGSAWSDLWINSNGNRPLPNGATVDFIQISLVDHYGHAPSSEYLPTSAPDLQAYSEKSVTVIGSSVAGSYTVVFEIDSVTTVAPDALIVLPASGSSLQVQHFDAALLVSQGKQISSMQATVNGTPVQLTYPGTCTLAPPNSQSRPAILCPNVTTQLQSGPNHVQWQIQLSDGTQAETSVDWEEIP